MIAFFCRRLHRYMWEALPSCCAKAKKEAHDCLMTLHERLGVLPSQVCGWVRSDNYCPICRKGRGPA